jgi:hypothetical protein
MLLIKPSLNYRITHLLAFSLGTAWILLQTPLSVSAQNKAEATLNQIFRSDVPFPGTNAQEQQNLMMLKTSVTQWMGSYQGVREEKDRYLILFERGSIPVTIQFRENGNPKSVSVVGCPVTSAPVSQAPLQYRKVLLSNCPNLKP